MLKTGQFTNNVNKALMYLVKSKDAGGTWGSTPATILSLKALIRAAGGSQQKGTATFTITVNGKEAAKGEVTEENADVMQVFDLKDFAKPGANAVTIEVKGETNLMYQIVGPALRAVAEGGAGRSRCWTCPWTTTGRSCRRRTC